jgi:hypothetical protein
MLVACPFHGLFSFDPKDLPNFAPLSEKQAVEIRATKQHSEFQTTVTLFDRTCGLSVKKVGFPDFFGEWKEQ